MQIKDSVALVTGANRGIGREFVAALAARGARRIYAAMRDPAGYQAPAGPVEVIALDITDPSAVAEAAIGANDVRLLINNAGINRVRRFLDQTDDAAARAEMETNYFGTLAMCRAFAPIIAGHGGGAIVNVLSVLARITLPAMGSLCASKAAAYRMTDGIRAELKAKNVSVLAVLPGVTDTDMMKDYPPPKMPPAFVANAALDAVEQGVDEIYPGDMASGMAAGLIGDRAAIRAELANYL